jgi:L-alanine-DL-glutamate epimerase-like enolase superfamily enzyme
MKIVRCEVERRSIPLKAPFTISYNTQTDAELLLVRLVTDGPHLGIGVAAPSRNVTGETVEAAERALTGRVDEWIRGRGTDPPAPACRGLAELLPDTPGARAAVDMALHDLWGKAHGKPVVELLGRAHAALPTSMTLGIRTLEESLLEAREFLAMGYTTLKVKCGADLDHDLELLARLREEFGNDVGIRVDANQGYDANSLLEFLNRTVSFDLEFVEQPFPAADIDEQRKLPEEVRRRLCVDENLLDERSMLRLASEPKPAGIANIKLMKCGGMFPAMRIATIADAADITLMWGCMIESVVGLAAALHAALACPNTRYLDLDGDWDLVEDVATGGMILENGVLRTVDAPGLGAQCRD